MYVNRARPDGRISIPYVDEQLLPAEHTVTITEQELQQLVLSRCECQILAIDGDPLTDIVDRYAADGNGLRATDIRRPAQARRHTGKKFRQIYRLTDKIVGARLEGTHGIIGSLTARRHQHSKRLQMIAAPHVTQ